MAEVFDPPLQPAAVRPRWYRSDTWLAVTGLVGAALALPLPPGHWHLPEVAAVLAVSATALAAGQRWAIALIVMTELGLVPTLWPRLLEGGAASRLMALATLAAFVPGVLAIPRAAAALVVITGQPRTHRACRATYVGLIALGVIAAALPVL